MKTLPGLSLLKLSNKSELFRTSRRYSEAAVGNAGKTSVEMFYGCACSGGQKKVHIRCIGREARLPGGTRPRMAQGHHQPSTTTFLDPFPPHFISLSSSLYFSFLLTLFFRWQKNPLDLGQVFYFASTGDAATIDKEGSGR